MVKYVLLIAVLCLPVAAWAFYKPVRVLAPELVSGVTCVTDVVCTDDVTRYPEAAGLYSEAAKFVDSSVGTIAQRPRAVFCFTEACFQSFGFHRSTARHVGISGIVISPRGWKPAYVRHEMIHHLQAERLGILTQWLGPRWFMEGMAYSLSEDPREKLSEPWETYRNDFDQWLKETGKEKLWEEAGRL